MDDKADFRMNKQLALLVLPFMLSTGIFGGHITSIKSQNASPGKFSIQTARRVVAIALATSSPSIRTPEITRGDVRKKEVIFTFDGGGGIQSADTILQVLAKHHLKGTFFLTGKIIEAHPDLVRRIVAAGNEIFSHTYDHPVLTTLSDGRITEELTKMENVLQATAHISPRPYFRAPYGARNARVLAVAAKDGYQSVYWTVDALDWKEPQGETASQVKARILSRVAPGTIYLMHIGDNITGSILDDVFTSIESKGYKIVSLTQGI